MTLTLIWEERPCPYIFHEDPCLSLDVVFFLLLYINSRSFLFNLKIVSSLWRSTEGFEKKRRHHCLGVKTVLSIPETIFIEGSQGTSIPTGTLGQDWLLTLVFRDPFESGKPKDGERGRRTVLTSINEPDIVSTILTRILAMFHSNRPVFHTQTQGRTE